MHTLRTRLRPLLSVVALGLTLGVLLTPVGMAHLDLAPDVCDAPPPAPDGRERLGSVASTDLHDHCFTCHWLQSFRSTLIVSGVVVIEATGSCQLPTDRAARVVSVCRHALPARAPPPPPTSHAA